MSRMSERHAELVELAKYHPDAPEYPDSGQPTTPYTPAEYPAPEPVTPKLIAYVPAYIRHGYYCGQPRQWNISSRIVLEVEGGERISIRGELADRMFAQYRSE